MLKPLRDVLIVWGVVRDEPALKAEREMNRADLQLLEVESLYEEAEHAARLLRYRISRLSTRKCVGAGVERRVTRQIAAARIRLMESEAQAEELAAKVGMLKERIGRLKPLVDAENAAWATA
jgi:hypothetical protein